MVGHNSGTKQLVKKGPLKHVQTRDFDASWNVMVDESNKAIAASKESQDLSRQRRIFSNSWSQSNCGCRVSLAISI